MYRPRRPFPDDEAHWLVIPIGQSLDPGGDHENAARAIDAGARILKQPPLQLPPRPLPTRRSPK
jgi:hypothetical protein